MTQVTYFVDVLLPLPFRQLFTYRVPRDWDNYLELGKRVVVPFGKSKLYTGLISEIHQKAPVAYEAKYLEAILDDIPIVTEKQFRFWDWLADYYMCTSGEVMNAALPGSFNLASETKVMLNSDYREALDILTDKEYLIVDALEINHILTLNDISRIIEQKTVYPIIKKMIDKGVIIVEETIKEKYKPKKEKWVQLAPSFQENQQEAFQLVSRAPKQEDVLLAFLELCRIENISCIKKNELERKSGVSSAIIKQLVAKGIFEEMELEVGRITDESGEFKGVKLLNEHQEEARQAIKQSFTQHDVCLLFGVTSSGKTEVYANLIHEVISQGKQVLFLVPEIALTAQLINRLRNVFGDEVGVYHSNFSGNERVEIWRSMMSGNLHRYKVILGARSSIFLPFQNLGLVVVDEEHETSFKQFDPAPRYHARDAAVVLAKMFGAKVLLGSATPSVESYYNAQQGKYGLVLMKKRFGDVLFPEIITEDLKSAKSKDQMRSMFSQKLLDRIGEVLKEGNQVILFQNRRGFVPIWKCNTCGWTPKCKSCDISMTYHKYSHQLKCHYCGYTVKPYKTCQACGSSDLEMIGFGTEKVEEELKIFFPEASVKRMDLDTTRKKNAYEELINDFESGKIDVLIGTQMVTKGLDFDHVALVGILSADNMLNFPDFRAYERAFQLMLQVAGRAGRRGKQGQVMIQTYSPHHFIIQMVMEYNYEEMYQAEINEREIFHYPPIYRLIKITIKGKDLRELEKAASLFANELAGKLGKGRFIGPEAPLVSKVMNYYLRTIMVKLEPEASVNKAKQLILEAYDNFVGLKISRGVRVVFDVDCY
jgi:primosomal protein N' (replication factor Y) (superfamily II helicase)